MSVGSTSSHSLLSGLCNGFRMLESFDEWCVMVSKRVIGFSSIISLALKNLESKLKLFNSQSSPHCIHTS